MLSMWRAALSWLPSVFICSRNGRRLNDAEATAAIHQGVTAVLDLTAEFSKPRPFDSVTYHSMPILDLTAPTLGQLREAVNFITEQAATGRVYVHCKIGYSRSA